MTEQGQPQGEQIAAVAVGRDAEGHGGADGGAAGASPAAGERSSIAAALPVGSELAQERPEVLVGGAFVVGFLVGRILKHLTSE